MQSGSRKSERARRWLRRGALASGATLAIVVAGCATVNERQVVAPPGSTSEAGEFDSERGLRRKVVIARFSNTTAHGKSLLLGDRDLLAGQAADMLSTELTRSGEFLLFERTDPAPLLEALDRGELASSGLPADFLILGSVSEFGRETTSEKGVFSRTKKQVARAGVDIRLVDVRNSRSIFAAKGTGEAEIEVGTVMGVGSSAGYDSTLNDKAIRAAILDVVNELMATLRRQPWRSYVLDVDGETVTIGGGGSQNISAGDRFVVERRGKVVKNPQTGTDVELPGEKVATLEVVSTHGETAEEEFSLCRVVDGAAPSGDLTAYSVKDADESGGGA